MRERACRLASRSEPATSKLTSPGQRTLLDGAWATELQRRGLAPGACPDEWNLSHPDQVEAVARSYVEAGSRIILTNTFGANGIALSRHGLTVRAREINRTGARLSRRAAGARAQVFASIGPSGKMLGGGRTTEAELRAAFEEQAQALVEEGVDGLVLETFSDLDELCIALAAARGARVPVVACMVFDFGPRRDRTLTGVTPEQAAERLSAAGADAVGSNCGGIEGFEPVCRRLRAATDLPIWLKPNAGLPRTMAGKLVYDAVPEQFAQGAIRLFEAGASFVGGCCGAGPAFVRAIAEACARP